MGSGLVCETMQTCMDIRTGLSFNASVCCVKQSVHNYNVVLYCMINRFDLVARSVHELLTLNRIIEPLRKQKYYQVHSIYNTKLCAVGVRKLPQFVHKPMSK